MELKKRKIPRYDINSSIFDEHINVREKLKWTTSTGKDILIKDMDKNHIKNAVAKIKRGEHPSREVHLKLLEIELQYREALDRNKTKNHVKDGQKRSLKGITKDSIKPEFVKRASRERGSGSIW